MKTRITTPKVIAALISASAPRVHGEEAAAPEAPSAPAEAEPKKKGGNKKAEDKPAGEQGSKDAPVDQIIDVPNTRPEPTERDQMLPIKNLVMDADTQARQSLDVETVEKYRDVIMEAKKSEQPNPMPAIDVVRDRDGKLYPFDGFHRINAHKEAKEKEIAMNLFEPPEGWNGADYAQLLSLGVNDTHGKPRTKKDQLRALKRALVHPVWSKWTNTTIASIVGCSEGTVRNHRSSFAPSERLAKRAGKVIKMKTGGIGRKGGKKSAKTSGKGGKGGGASTGTGAGEGAGTSAAGAAANASKADQERRANIIKIAESQPTDKVGEVRKALENDTLGLSAKDLKDWAMNSKERIRQLSPLIIDKRWKPSRAVAFIDREMTGKTTLDDIALTLLTRPDKRSETVAGLEITIHANSIEIRLSTAPIT